MSWQNCRLVLWVGENPTSEEESLESYSRIPQSDLQTAFLSLAAQTHANLTRRGWGSIRNEKTEKWEGRERESRIRMTGKVQTFVQRAVTDGEKAIATTACACVWPELLPGCCACVLCSAPCRLQRQFLGLLHTHTNTHAHAQNPLLQQRYNFLKPSLPAKQAKEELWSEEWLERGKKKKKKKFGYVFVCVCVCVCVLKREKSPGAHETRCVCKK